MVVQVEKKGKGKQVRDADNELLIIKTETRLLDPFLYDPETLKFLEQVSEAKIDLFDSETRTFTVTGDAYQRAAVDGWYRRINRYCGPFFLDGNPDPSCHEQDPGYRLFYAHVPENLQPKFGSYIIIKAIPLWKPINLREGDFEGCPTELLRDAFLKLAHILCDDNKFDSYYASKEKSFGNKNKADVLGRQFVINVPNDAHQGYVIQMTLPGPHPYFDISQSERHMIANLLEMLARILYEGEEEDEEEENPGGEGYPLAPVQQEAGYGYGCVHPPPYPSQPGYSFGFYPPNHQSQAAGGYDNYSQGHNTAYQQSYSLGQAYQQGYAAGYANASVQRPAGYYGPPRASGQPTCGQPPPVQPGYYMQPGWQWGGAVAGANPHIPAKTSTCPAYHFQRHPPAPHQTRIHPPHTTPLK